MKQAILIHGYPDKEEYFNPAEESSSNRHWFPWLQQQLIVNGILTQTPEMLDAWEPRYEKWKSVFEQFSINEDTILVGHSCGAGFLVRYLSENKIKVGKVFLVAPWIDPSHEERDSIMDFFDFELDTNLSDRTAGITIFISSDDEKAMLDTVDVLEKNLKKCSVRKFEGMGHFTEDDMRTKEFPELLEEIIR